MFMGDNEEGILPMRTEARAWFQKLSTADKWILGAGGAFLATLALQAAIPGLLSVVLTCEVKGSVICAAADVPLDTGEYQTSQRRWRNACIVQYTAGNKTETVSTDQNGFYHFKDVPSGYDIYVQAVSASNRRRSGAKWEHVSYTPSRAYWVGKVESRGLTEMLLWKTPTLAAPVIEMPPDRSRSVTLGD